MKQNVVFTQPSGQKTVNWKALAATFIGLVGIILVSFGILTTEEASIFDLNADAIIESIGVFLTSLSAIIHLFKK